MANRKHTDDRTHLKPPTLRRRLLTWLPLALTAVVLVGSFLVSLEVSGYAFDARAFFTINAGRVELEVNGPQGFPEFDISHMGFGRGTLAAHEKIFPLHSFRYRNHNYGYYFRVMIPLYYFLAFFATASIWMIVVRKRVIKHGCPSCGYDLRGNRKAKSCPECGTDIKPTLGKVAKGH